jgi:hypothetical protein
MDYELKSGIYIYMTLRVVVDLGRFFKFLNLYTIPRNSLNGGSVHRNAATYTQNNTNTQ